MRSPASESGQELTLAHATREDEPSGSAISPAIAAAQTQPDTFSLLNLLAQMPTGIGLLSGPELRWAYVNDAFVRMARRADTSDFLGKTVRGSLPEIQAKDFVELLENVYRSGQPYTARETKILLEHGEGAPPSEVYIDFVYQPVRAPDGRIDGVLVHATEATERVQARRMTEEYAERLTMAQTAAHVGAWEWDPVRNRQVLSLELHQIFGTTASDPDWVQKWASRVRASDWQRLQLLMEEGHRNGSMEFEYGYEHPQLGLRLLYCRGRRFGRETGMFGIVQDITDRRFAENASHRLASIVESSDDAIISKDLNGVVTSWNPSAERIFGYTAAEMVGQPILRIIPPHLHADEARILGTITRGERIEHFETVRLRKNGEHIEVSITVSPVKDRAGKIVGAAKIARDITQRKKAERALQTTERLASVGRLAATVAHEINNPLEAVTNLIYLARHTTSHGDVRKFLSLAEEELERVAHLTRQTLGFYRETKGATNIRLGDLVASLLSVFASRARNKGIELCPEIDDKWQAYAVPGEIRQVVANLVSNSIDALDAGGRVCIRVSSATRWSRSQGRGVRLTVADTGTGIPGGVRAQIFEPFFTTKKDVGTGLGLWVCKNIIESYRGTIQVRSDTTPGKSWTAFSVFLPLDAQDQPAANG